MNIKEIVDKIPKEADINPSDYTVADRIVDVNQKYLELIEKAVQIGSKSPISRGETFSETFTVVSGSQTFTRTIKDTPIFRVDFKSTGSTKWCKVDEDPNRLIDGFCFCDMKFFTTEKEIFVENGLAGDLRITYVRGNVTLFTTADYSATPPPSPEWLPVTFHALLWLYPALTQAMNYKPDRVAYLKSEVDSLQKLFDNHYLRESIKNSKFSTQSNSCFGGDNYR